MAGKHCPAQATVHADPTEQPPGAGLLVCMLPDGHGGRVHFDPADEIWWSRADGDPEAEPQ